MTPKEQKEEELFAEICKVGDDFLRMVERRGEELRLKREKRKEEIRKEAGIFTRIVKGCDISERREQLLMDLVTALLVVLWFVVWYFGGWSCGR